MAATDMTRGPVTKHLVSYAVPLVLGSLFQLTYNAVDAIIAGRFIGRDALAAEGIASPVMNLVIHAICGVCIGAGVLMAEFFGAKKEDRLRSEMATTLLFGAAFSCLVALAGILCTEPLLTFLQVPDAIRAMTGTYLRITFLGAPFTYFYNALASALKAVGDSKTPLKFLMFSSVLNAVLDLIFLGVLHFGIVCSATTTVIAEAVSALLSFWYIWRKVPLLRLESREWRIDRKLLGATLRYGGVTALQQTVQPIGKLLIQSQINALGVDVIAAFNACARVDDFAFTPEQSISHAMTTFIAQNRGAKQEKRVGEGFRKGMLLEAGYWVLICTATLLFRRHILGWFVTGADAAGVIEVGAQYLGAMALFYLLPGMTNGVQGYFRGRGMMTMTLIGTLTQTTVRVLGTFLLAPRMGIVGIAYACAAGWSLMLCIEIPAALWVQHRKKRELAAEKAA